MAKRGKVAGPAKVLEGRPVLRVGLIHFWEAYSRLSSCRQLGYGMYGEIPWTAVDAYAYRYKYWGSAFDELLHYVEVLDGVYLQSQATSGKTNKKPPVEE